MRKMSSYFLLVSMLLTGMFFSCKKESDETDNKQHTNQANHPPVANAGVDQIITLPANAVNLDAGNSNDPDKNIASYLWTKISGPLSLAIADANAVQTQVTNLTEGVYQFELKVIDAERLFDKDTVQITVNAATPTSDTSNRPTLNVQLIPLGTLSQPRIWMGIAGANDKIAFAGGLDGNYVVSSKVDIYNVNMQSWTTANLSVARDGIAAVSADNKIFFAGGEYYTDRTLDNAIDVDVMDIYDAVAETWSVVMLPGKRLYTAATAAGNKLFFVVGNTTDIYDITSGTWTTASMSDGRFDPAVVAADNKVYFAGGSTFNHGIAAPSNKIDIYDNTTGAWSFSSLVEGRSDLAGIEAGGQIYFAGGYNSDINSPPVTTSGAVDVIDAKTGNQSVQFLSRRWHNPGLLASKDNKIVFLPIRNPYFDKDECDIYDIDTNTWYIGILPRPALNGPQIVSVNNAIYVTAGTDQVVYKLEF